MDTKSFSLAMLLIIAFTSIYSTCKKEGFGCANNVYSFKASAEASPDKDSIHIGDTIWIRSNISTKLVDQVSGQIIDYRNASNLSQSIQLLKLVGGDFSNPGAIYAANNFTYSAFAGTQINDPFSEGQRSFSFMEQNSVYKLSVAIVARDTGTYLLAISDAVNVSRLTDKCTRANYGFYFENTNQHLYFNQNNRPGYAISSYEQTHAYCFKVY